MLVYHDFFCYSDPDQRFLKWIRIRPNDTDPTGSETLYFRVYLAFKLLNVLRKAFKIIYELNMMARFFFKYRILWESLKINSII